MSDQRAALPNTALVGNRVPCNEPLRRGDDIIGYCEVPIKRHKPWHRGPHRITWRSR